MMAYMVRDETSSRANVGEACRWSRAPANRSDCQHHGVGGQHGLRIAGRFQQQQPELELVDPQHQDGVIEFARHRQRPPLIASSVNFRHRLGCSPSGARR